MTVNKDYRQEIYKDYANSFKNSTGKIDDASADKWEPCLVYYLRDWLPADKDAQIIDLGCGDGRILYLLQHMGYSNVTGVDISDSQLNIARQVSGQIEQADVLEYLKNTPKKYHLILSFDLIEHLKKDEVLEFIKLCKTRLNKGRRLILQTPNASSPFFGDVRYGDFTHELAFTPKLLSQLLAREKFMNLESREAGPVPRGYSFKSTIRYFLWNIFRAFLCLFETAETGGCKQRIYTRVFLQSGVTGND